VSWTEPEPIVKLRERVSALILDGKQAHADALMAEACLARPFGLYVLLRYGLGRKDAQCQWVFDRCCEVQASPDGHLDLWAREHYKDLADDTPILTANRGWTIHGELRVGDRVYSPDGVPVAVIALSPRYSDSECYRLTFSDGASIVCGAGHLWRIRQKHKRRVSGTDQRYVSWSEHIVPTHALNGGENVGVAHAIVGEAQQLPLDPYVLGAWLGDGTRGSPHITSSYDDAPEMAELLAARGVKVSRVDRPHCVTLRLGTGVRHKRGSSDVVRALRELGILRAKAIPAQYLRASVHQRMQLLRGLMDTDGHCDARGTATFVNTNRSLVDGVYELATGLGLRPRRRDYGTFWQVSMQAHQDRNPFAIKRKAERALAHSSYRDSRWIKAAERVSSVPTRCIQVEGGMYLAGRELVPTHNSTIITFAANIQDILRDPEVTIGIFSHTRPIAKAFLRQIMQELDRNERLKRWFPEILWADPRKQSPKWSEDEGIVVKRKANPKEATVEAWGVVDGQPTSKHFDILDFDDVVVPASVTTPEMIAKTTASLELAYNLGRRGGRRRFVGTRYHFNDTYRTLLDRGTASPRIYPATADGNVDGEPVFLSRSELAKKRSDQGPYTFGCQMLLDPTADNKQGFKEEWIRFARVTTRGHNLVILVDPASAKKKDSDYTAMWCLGLGPDRNVYVHDILRDRLSLTERATMLMAWHRKYRPMAVGWEQYGMMADIEHIRDLQERENYRFDITALGGTMAKPDRIRRLIPWFEKGRLFLPPSLVKTNYEGRSVDLVQAFINDEYRAFPVAVHDDMLDALSRFLDEDMPIAFPLASEEPEERELETVGRNGTTGY
jgi:predicted phage terminase large subunit-like protein